VTDSSQKQARRYLREWVAAAFFVAAAGIGCLIYFQVQPSFRSELLITAGSSSGLRSQIARRLAQAARTQGLTLKVQGSLGSIDALDKVDRGVLDLALVQGGLDPAHHPRIRQVAAMYVEPLHLLVKPELHASVQRNLASLRGKTVNLSVSGSGTHELALDVLQFAGLRPPLNGSSGDYQVVMASYQELESQIDSRNLPDAIFTVSALPSPLVAGTYTGAITCGGLSLWVRQRKNALIAIKSKAAAKARFLKLFETVDPAAASALAPRRLGTRRGPGAASSGGGAGSPQTGQNPRAIG